MIYKIVAAICCAVSLSGNALAMTDQTSGKAPLPADKTDYFCFLIQTGLHNGLKVKALKAPLTAEDIEKQKKAQVQMIFFLGRISTEPEIEVVTKLNAETQAMLQTRGTPKSYADLKACDDRIARFTNMLPSETPPVISPEP